MSDENKTNASAKRKRRTRSLVSSRFGIQLPILLLFVAFAVAAGLFLFREISADRFRIMRGADPIYFTSDKVDGLGFGSDLRCQGLTVGRVRVVKVLDTKKEALKEVTVKDHTIKRVEFWVEATLEKPYAKWTFEKEAIVSKGVGPAYLGLASVELQIVSTDPADAKDGPQQLVLKYSDGNLQNQATQMLQALVSRADELEKRVKTGEATSIERIVWNVDQATHRLDDTLAKLAKGENGNPSPVDRLISTIKELEELAQELRKQVKELTSQTLTTVEKSQEAITVLIAKVDAVEKGVLQVIGETPAQRRGFQRDLQSTVDNLQQASATLKDILPRVGDTALGKMLIRKKQGAEEPDEEATPAPRRKSGPRN